MISRPGKVLAQKGKKSVVHIIDGKHGKNVPVTLFGCCGAKGYFPPPMVIMKGARQKEEQKNPCSLLEMSESSYINNELFLRCSYGSVINAFKDKFL